MLLTLDKLKNVGAISVDYELQDYHGTNRATLAEVNFWSDKKKSRFDGVISCDNVMWAATLKKIPIAKASKVYTSDGKSLVLWDRKNRIAFRKELVGNKLVTISQVKMPLQKIHNKEDINMAAAINLEGNLADMDLGIGPNEHASFEEYRDWKAKLFTLCKTGIFNVDDANAAYMMEHATCEKLTYGECADADYRAKDIELYREKGVLGIQYALCGKLDAKIVVDLPGEFSVHNSLAAVAVADQMQVGITDIQNILKEAKARGRVEMIPISDSFTLMIDYAHNAMALESLLTALRAYNPKRLVTLFGCGGNRSRDRRFEMGEVSGKMSDFTIITSDNPRDEEPLAIIADIETGMKKTDGEYVKIADRKEAIRYAILHAKEGDVIVLAGKGHEDYQEIHGVKHHMDERDLIREILEEEDVTNICGYNNRYFA